MASINVASVTAEVVPDARTFKERLDAQLKGLSATVDLKLLDEQVKAELDRITRGRHIDIDVNAGKAIAELEAVDVAAKHLDGSTSDLGKSALRATEGLDNMGGSLGEVSSKGAGSPALLLGVAAAATLVGPASGAAAAATIGLGASLGVAALAYRGFKAELADGSAQGAALQTRLDGITSSFDHLGSVAALSAGPGVLGALSQIDAYLSRLDGPVAGLAKDLGDALNIGAGGLIAGLETATPLMQDAGGYAKDLANDLADFAASQQFRDFIDYAGRELPLVTSTLGDVGKAVVNLAEIMAPSGEAILTDLDAVAKGINEVAKAQHFLHEVNTLGGLLDFGSGPKDSAKALDQQSAAAKSSAAAMKLVDAAVKRNSASTAVSVPIVNGFGDVLYDVNGKATDANTAISDLENSIRGLGNTSLDVRAAERSFQQAIDDATASAKKNGKTLNQNTQAGRDNAAVLDRIATTNHGVTASLIANHASQQRVNASMKEGRAAYIAAAVAMGASRSEAKRLADQAGFTAGDVRKVNDALREAGRLHPKPTITVQTGGALQIIDQVRSAIASLHDKHITITTTQTNAFNRMAAGRTQYKADGGPIIGPGTKTSDSVPVMGSNGEYMIQAAAVDKYGTAFFDQINAMRLAAGGPVTQRPAAPAGPVAVGAAFDAPMHIEGRLDLGNGLSGYVDGRITGAVVGGGKKRRL